jgi:hypothetical protein
MTITTETRAVQCHENWWDVEVRWTKGEEHGPWHMMGAVSGADAEEIAKDWAKTIKDDILWEEEPD